MNAIFLSYRRDDSAGFAGRLADALEAEFGPVSVFRDVDDIRPGDDFVQAIESHLRAVSAVLVMIGPNWLDASSAGKRRLDDAGDFVRQEIQAGLASGKPLIPLLVGNATMPLEADLPAAIAGLSRRQAVVLSDSHWRSDVERFVKDLRTLLPDGRKVPVKRRWVAGLVCSVIGVAAMGWAFQTWRQSLPAEPAHPVAASSPKIDVTGRWTARIKYDWGDQYDEVFEFKYLGDALHGTASYQTGRLALAQATVKGEWIRFVTHSQEMLGSSTPWKEVTHRYTGQVTADGIHFTMESGGGYSIHPPLEFTARRVQAP